MGMMIEVTLAMKRARGKRRKGKRVKGTERKQTMMRV